MGAAAAKSHLIGEHKREEFEKAIRAVLEAAPKTTAPRETILLSPKRLCDR